MLALIIVYHDHPEILKDFFESLRQTSNHNFTLFIADLSHKLRMKNNLDFAEQIIDGKNKGYSYGINLCLKAALKQGFTEFCVLNYDVLLAQNFISQVKKRFKQADCFGGKIYYAKGYEYHKKRYVQKDLGKVLWYAGGKIDWNHATVAHRGVDEVDRKQYNKVEKTDFITGALLCFTKKVVDKIGFWDEKYFLYYEDTDYCVRAKKAGFELIYDPEIIIWHKNSGTTGGPGSQFHTKHQGRSRLLFGLKQAPFKTKIHLVKNYVSR